MHPNAALVSRFYTAFQARDAASMGACYAPDVRFSDPVFPDLHGDDARAMWSMLCAAGGDLVLTFDDVHADDHAGRAHWVATYTFAATGRKVVNDIHARFAFRDGYIAEHQDTFDLWRWTRMALGPVGVFLGWTPMVQGKVRAQAARALAKYRAGQHSV